MILQLFSYQPNITFKPRSRFNKEPSRFHKIPSERWKEKIMRIDMRFFPILLQLVKFVNDKKIDSYK